MVQKYNSSNGTKQPTTTRTRNITNTTQQLPQSTFVSVFTSFLTVAGGLTVAPPDVVLTTQTIQYAQCLPYDEKSSTVPGGSRRPWVSFSRIIPAARAANGDAWEVMMLLVTAALVYVTHFILAMIMWRLSKKKWNFVVRKCRYPALSIRYHISILLPLVASVIVSWRGMNNVLVVTVLPIIGSLCFFYSNPQINILCINLSV
eukprot:PhF_6_TR40903/c0_g1_i2/m.61877